MVKIRWRIYSMAKGGQMETTGDQETDRTLETNSEVSRGSQNTKEARDNIQMIGLSMEIEKEDIEVINRKDWCNGLRNLILRVERMYWMS